MCNESCKKEFAPKNFTLWHWTADGITKSAWVPLPVLLVYRIIVALYCVAIFIYNIHRNQEYFFIYFTNWTFMVVICYFLAASNLSLLQAIRERAGKNRMTIPDGSNPNNSASYKLEMSPVLGQDNGPGTTYGASGIPNVSEEEFGESGRQKDALKPYHKFVWLSFIIGANLSLFLIVGYWPVVYDPLIGETFVGYTKHLLIGLFCLIDFGMSGVPVRVYHALYPVVFTFLYLIFTVIYWKAGGKTQKGDSYLYKQLDYDTITATNATIVAFFFFLVLPTLHFLYFGLYKLREKIVSLKKS